MPVGLLLEKSMEGRGLDITPHQEQVKELGVLRWAECRLRESPNCSLKCERGCRAEVGFDFCREGNW